jgi:DNA polymerase IV
VSDRRPKHASSTSGLHTIGDVAAANPKFLLAKLGSVGLHFHTLAQAQDSRPVIGRRVSKSIGSEHTLERDVREKAEIKLHLRRSADAIGRRLRRKEFVAFGVGIKLKTADFQIVTRQHRLDEPTDVGEKIYSVGVELLNHVDLPGPFRLVGMVAYELVGLGNVAQLNLFGTPPRRRRLEIAIDDLVARFGTQVISRATDLIEPAGLRLAPTLDFLDDRPLD